MVIEGLLVGLAVVILFLSEFYLGYPMTRRPLVVCTVVGFILGDLETGIKAGATLELVFMGIVTVGAATPPDTLTGSAIGTAFAILLGQGTELAFTLAVPISFLAQFLIVSKFIWRSSFNSKVEKYIEEGNYKAIEKVHLSMTLALAIILGSVTALSIMLGAPVMDSFINKIPKVIIDGLSAAGGLLPAVGFALLLKLMWSQQMSIYYFLGFIFVTYFNIPIIAIAAIGVIMSFIFYQEGNFKLLNNKLNTATDNEEDDLFDD